MNAMMKMWVSFAGIAFLIIAFILISLSRYKLSGWLAKVIALIAYLLLLLGGLITLFIVFSGPSPG